MSEMEPAVPCIQPKQDPNAVIPPKYDGLVDRADYEVVKRCVKEWGQVIRERLKARMGLSSAVGRAAVGLSVNADVPDEMARLIEVFTSPLLMFKMRRGLLVQGIEVDRQLLDFLQAFPAVAGLAGFTGADEQTMGGYRSLLDRLLKFADGIAFREKFAEIDEDVLGSYKPAERQVAVYWIPLAIFSSSSGLDLEELTKVVLVHEYAHAFTHVGLDINNRRWGTKEFIRADRLLTEGLAQFYTAEITSKMRRIDWRDDEVDAYATYERLLKYQSRMYHSHLPWMHEDTGLSGEAIRFALLEARADQRYSDYTAFTELIQQNMARLESN